MSSQDDKLRNAVSALLAAQKAETQLRHNFAIAVKAVPAATTRLVDAIRETGKSEIVWQGVRYRRIATAATLPDELRTEPSDAIMLDE